MKVLAIGMLFVANSAMAADWSGTWSGTATATQNGESQEVQETVTLTQSETVFTLVESVFGWETSYTVQGQDLYVGDVKVGSYNDSTFSVAFTVASEDATCKQTYTVTRDNNNVKFLDDYTCDNDQYVKVEGTLAPAPAQAIVKSNKAKL